MYECGLETECFLLWESVVLVPNGSVNEARSPNRG